MNNKTCLAGMAEVEADESITEKGSFNLKETRRKET